ncbi:gliding motility lipoprotein GldB [Robertkochia sediminum]|uniref:gliding motility lipoprotein GldB n=1 Tax=Robertkochia sediminum TaxID=2785326 RepID=UPI0019331091|nr:gliding motility lipoprotein GldB [Robertkochia sediminum]MBL7472463.1 gliding motility lipoprotein GldB [Robertkochia sediminum]
MKKILILLMVVAGFYSCSQMDQREKEIAAIDVDLEVKRFDLAFAAAGQNDLPVLKEQFPYLFPAQFADSVWYKRMEDTLQQELLIEVSNKFSGFDSQTNTLETLFKHVHYYFPNLTIPDVVTVTSDVDYRNRVIYADSLLLIGLDNYLGADHRFYEGIQQYIRKNLEPERIPVDVAEQVALRLVSGPENRSFLAKVIYFGKLHYLMQQLLPEASGAAVMGYTENEFAWVQANESEIWRYFIDRDLLFSTDSKLDQRFLNPAPFSKFYLELDHDSPGRVGRYIGWQIVSAYMENNEVSLQQMLGEPAEKIFNDSRFKPLK